MNHLMMWILMMMKKTNDCIHEDAVSTDEGYMYCPDCNEMFKECN